MDTPVTEQINDLKDLVDQYDKVRQDSIAYRGSVPTMVAKRATEDAVLQAVLDKVRSLITTVSTK